MCGYIRRLANSLLTRTSRHTATIRSTGTPSGWPPLATLYLASLSSEYAASLAAHSSVLAPVKATLTNRKAWHAYLVAVVAENNLGASPLPPVTRACSCVSSGVYGGGSMNFPKGPNEGLRDGCPQRGQGENYVCTNFSVNGGMSDSSRFSLVLTIRMEIFSLYVAMKVGWLKTGDYARESGPRPKTTTARMDEATYLVCLRRHFSQLEYNNNSWS